MTEQLANSAQTTINQSGGIASGDSSVIVTSATAFPSSGNFRILIDSEIILVTSVSGSTFTISRGQESTTAASHTNGATVTCILTKGSLTQFRNDMRSSAGLANSRPAATGSGACYYCTDIPVFYFDDPNTTAWKQFATEYLPAPAAASSYTTVGNVSLVQYGDSIRAMCDNNVASNGACALLSGSLGSSSTWVVNLTTSYIGLLNSTYPEIGVVVSTGTSSGSSSAYAIALFYNGGSIGTHIVHFTVAGARSSVSNEVSFEEFVLTGTGRLHMRLLADGVNIHYQLSTDGFNWQDWLTEATPSSLNNFGFFMGNEFTSGNAYGQAVVYQNSLTTLTVAQQTITAATNANPVVLTVNSAAGFQAGDYVAIHGCVGNTTPNTGTGNGTTGGGTLITAISGNNITLGGVTGNGTYTANSGTLTLLSR